MNNSLYYVGVDIGKTKISCGLFTAELRLVHSIGHSSGKCAQEILDITESLISTVISCLTNIGGIGIGTFGIVDNELGVVLSSGIIEDWNNIPLREYFEKRFHIPVLVENDVKAALYSEGISPTGKQYSSILYLSIGTNIGAAFMNDGYLLRGEHSRLGEIGRYQIRNSPYTLGHLLGGSGISLQYYTETGLHKTCQEVAAAAEAGDVIATQIFHRFVLSLSDLLHWFALCFDPGYIVIGGGVICHNPSLFQMINEQYQLDTMGHVPNLSIATFDTKSGIYGAAALVKNYLHNQLYYH